MRTILILILLITSTSSFAQKTDCKKFVPFFRTFNPEKLVHRLTRNVESEAEKVEAIHCWITHHIKYDVKKADAFDYSRIAPKKILRKRKAICTGYSDLFNEMCKHINIVSTEVPGYSKNHHVDLNDKFYFDEHVWNAVFINNEWKLVDATWDAGYVKPFRTTVLGAVVYVFTFGNQKLIKYKPKFKFYPTNTYLLKTGSEFLVDHVPTNPIWQLTDSILSVENSERDSSAYYSRKKVNIKDESNESLFDVRLAVLKMSQDEKDVYSGPIALEYNNKNHYPIAITKYILGYDLFEEIDPKSTDTSKVLYLCETALISLNSSKTHLDTALIFLERQKNELKANNLKKNTILREQNKELFASSKKVERNFGSSVKTCKVAKKSIQNITKSNKEKLKLLRKRTLFYKAIPLKYYNSEDSTKSRLKVLALQDSILQCNLRLTSKFQQLDSLNQFYLENFRRFRGLSSHNSFITSLIIYNRMYYSDDLDYDIRPAKDSLFQYKFMNDARLFESDNNFFMRNLKNETLKLRAYYNALYRHHNAIASEYVKLKRYHVNSKEITELYRKNLSDYKQTIVYYQVELEKSIINFQNWKNVCKIQTKKGNRESIVYKEEQKLEQRMYSVRSAYINKHYNALARLCKVQMSKINRTKSKIEVIQNRYTFTLK